MVIGYLTLDEHDIIYSSLNEICNGFHINDFEKKIGDSVDNVYMLFKKNQSIAKKKEHNLDYSCESFSKEALLIIIHAINQVCKELDDWEFSTRMGCYRDEVMKFKNKLIYFINKLTPPDCKPLKTTHYNPENE